MAMIKCKECGKEVSSKAESCPNCGVVIKEKPTFYGCVTLIVGGILIIIIAIIVTSNI